MYLKDVARAAGVSVATVSRVLANPGYPVRAQTRERVLVAAERLRYQPNGLARSLRLGHSNAIGVCVTTLDNPSAVATVDGIIQACRARNRQVQTTTTSFGPLEEGSQLQLFRQERLAGVISFPSGAPAEGYLRLQRAGTPVVVLNRRVPGLVAGRAARLRGRVRGGRGAPRRPSAPSDCRHPAGGHGTRRRLRPRLGGHPRAPEALGGPRARPARSPVAPGARHAPGHSRPAGERASPTALFTATAVATLIAMRVIGSDHGPGGHRVALVGTGDERWELLFPPRVPFLCLSSFSLGHEAAEILNELIDGGRDVGVDRETVIGTRFVDGTVELPAQASAGTGGS
jgi:DNA-binding LacI/PurR family transcriptional regulator